MKTLVELLKNDIDDHRRVAFFFFLNDAEIWREFSTEKKEGEQLFAETAGSKKAKVVNKIWAA